MQLFYVHVVIKEVKFRSNKRVGVIYALRAAF